MTINGPSFYKEWACIFLDGETFVGPSREQAEAELREATRDLERYPQNKGAYLAVRTVDVAEWEAVQT